jgi:hypothetical protein
MASESTDRLSMPRGVRSEVARRIADPKALDSLLGQPVSWDPSRWRRTLPGFERLIAAVEEISDASDVRMVISRGAVLALARQDDDLLLFLAAMVWGFGPRGRQFRVAEALGIRTPRGWTEPIDLAVTRRRLRELRHLAIEDPVDAFAQTVPSGARLHLPGIGCAFATKFLYVAAFDTAQRSGRLTPLILDANVASALGIRVGTVGPERYADYLKVCRELAPQRPDLVELALFEIGLSPS